MDETITIKVTTPADRYREQVEKANADPTLSYPFPIQSYPVEIQEFIHEVSESLGADRSMVGLTVLVVAASAIGNGAVLQVTATHAEPSILWGVIASPSGTAKSPVNAIVTKPLTKIHEALMIQNDERRKTHNIRQADYRAGLEVRKASIKKNQGNASKVPAGLPEEPPRLRVEGLITTDATQEMLHALSEGSPKGILSNHDELAGMFANRDKYSGAAGSDEAFMNTAYQGAAYNVARIGGGCRMIQRLSMSILGGIPPATLQEQVTESAKLSGFMGRMLFVSPEKKDWPVGSRGIAESSVSHWNSVIQKLYDIEVQLSNADGFGVMRPDDLTGLKQSPSVVVELSHEAEEVYEEFKQRLGKFWKKAEGFAESYLSKFRSHAHRIALVLHLLGWSSNQLEQDSVEISGECMERSVELCWFFIREVELIDYRAGLANQTTQEPSIEELCGIVEGYLVRNNKQGYISHSELRNGLKKRPGLESSDQLERVTLRMKENGTLENADSKTASNQTVTGYRYSPHR